MDQIQSHISLQHLSSPGSWFITYNFLLLVLSLMNSHIQYKHTNSGNIETATERSKVSAIKSKLLENPELI